MERLICWIFRELTISRMESKPVMELSADNGKEENMELVKGMLAGNVGCLSRLISLVERDDPEVPDIMNEVHPWTGRAYCVGITGLPGSGKSTIVDRLTTIARKKGLPWG